MNRLPVRNAGDRALCLFLEPYGEDYWIAPGKALLVLTTAEDVDAQFDVTVGPDLVSVWIHESDDCGKVVLDYRVTDEHGVTVECGHERPSEHPRPPEPVSG
ncbi:hypothetical protein [Amycolatopsis sp. NPDC059021]|uniref:hypothetical protein n=1 Tax=Amycolatopsis sp. NPDC059021 TaxID=3346704 RepID=UPI00366E15FA